MPTRPDWLSTDADETVVWRGGPRIRRILPTAVAATAWIVLLVAAAVLRGGLLRPSLLVAGGVLLALPAAGAVALVYLRAVATEYVLTDRGVYRRAGVLSTRVTRVGLDTVQRTELTKSVWGELFDYGTLAISTAGSAGVDLRFADLDDPESVRTELRRLIGAGDGSDGQTARPGALDAATADALRTEFGALRAAADRLDRAVSDR